MASRSTGKQPVFEGQNLGKPLIVVACATGQQGSAVARTLVATGKFRVRGFGRDLQKETARKLNESEDIELVNCDLAATQNLLPLFAGAYGAYLMTAGNDESMKHREREFGTRLVNACKEAGVKHIVWSSLPNIDRLSDHKLHMPAFTDKAEVESYIHLLQGKPLKERAFESATCIRLGFFYQNLEGFFAPKYQYFGPEQYRGLTGYAPLAQQQKIVWRIPETRRLTIVDVNDVGPVVAQIFQEPALYNGACIDIACEETTPEAMARIMARYFQKPVELQLVDRSEWAKEGGKEFADMFAWFDQYGSFGPNSSLDTAKKINPEMRTFEDYIMSEKDRYLGELIKS